MTLSFLHVLLFCVVFFGEIFFVAFCAASQQCLDYCNSKEINSGPDVNDLYCNHECKVKQCQWGCEHYEVGPDSTCQATCGHGWMNQGNSTGKARSLQQEENQYCSNGCLQALQTYAEQIRAQLPPLPVPELKNGMKSHSSVVLHWNSRRLTNVTYYVQARMPDTGTPWEITMATWLGDGDINVTDLRPFVTYKFQILLVITPRDFLSSNESEPITTEPYGAPSVAPQISDVSSPTPTVISVTWKPPMYTNGQLLGYYLTLTPLSPQSKDKKLTIREVAPDITQWTFRQLKPGQVYLVNVSATNSVGKGPAGSVNITTPGPGNLSTEDMPFLILAQDNKVVKQNMKLLVTSDPDTLLTLNSSDTTVKGLTVLFQTPGDEITGITLDVDKQMVYLSDSTNTIFSLSTLAQGQSHTIFSDLPNPSVLTLDWLRDILYVVCKLQIYQCDLQTDNCYPATEILPAEPADIKVDPINGFLFFTLSAGQQGLYRIDTGDITSPCNITSPRLAPYTSIVNDNFLTFTLDFNNILIYFPDESHNSMRSSSLDGGDVTDIRRTRTVRPEFQGMVGMVYYDELFYWTNGDKVMQEEYNSVQDKYYHNQLLMFADHFSGLNVLQRSLQPKPVPHSSPQSLQALFRTMDVIISWEPPKRLAYQGKGAWNCWLYDVVLLGLDGRQRQLISNVRNKSIVVSNLEPNTTYQIKVRAKSEIGTGPWSFLFTGRTLTNDAMTAKLLMIKPNQFGGGILMETDMFGERGLERAIVRGKVRDMTWTPTTVYLVTETGQLLSYRPGNMAAVTEYIPSVVSVAYDWLAGKIYMSLPPNPGVIKRADLSDLSRQEFVIQGLASHMTIDSINARLYWVTENSVESCLLNGEDHIKHFFIPYFSGSRVISLTLNFDLGKLLWYMKRYDRQELYMMDLIQGEETGGSNQYQLIGTVNNITNDSVLQYHYHRIFWQNSEQQIILGDLDVNHTSVVSERGTSIFLVQHPSLHPYPEGLNESSLKVIPNTIDPDNIICSGQWSKFNISWTSATVNYGKVFYEVSIQADRAVIMKTDQTWYELEGFRPYSLLTVRVTGYTYWGYGKPSTAILYSPMSAPSRPLSPRVFVTQSKVSMGSEICMGALFRWASPEHSNGVINQYIVTYWNTGSNQLIKKVLAHTTRHFSLDECLKLNYTYNFQVQACTNEGCSELTEIKTATAEAVNPVPRILLANATNIQVMDVDSTHNVHVIVTGTSPLAVTYLQMSQDERVFWVDYGGRLWQFSAEGRKKLLDLDVAVKDLTIDWISRTLYIASSTKLTNTSTITSYQLDEGIQKVQVERRNVVISSLIREPYSSTLFWTERPVSGSPGVLYYKEEGGRPLPMFSPRHQRSVETPCNCSTQAVGNVLALDHTKGTQLEILFYDALTRTVVSSDREGCHCRDVIKDEQGFPPDLLSVDHMLIYWYRHGENQLHSMDKVTGKLTQIPVVSIQSLEGYGSHLQPLPSDECLNPEAYNGNLSLTRSSNVSLTVHLDSVQWPDSCNGVSHPATKYIVYYRQTDRQGDRCHVDSQDCQHSESYGNEITLTGLNPYTSYTVHGSVSNYYTEYLSEALSQPFYFRTKVGVPSSPTNVNATVDTPITIKVSWSAPVSPNGPIEELKYMVKYSTQINSVHQVFNKTVKVEPDMDRRYVYNLTGLQPGRSYIIKVMSGNPDSVFSDESPALQVKTYENPGPIVLLNATQSSMSVSWTPPPDNSTHMHLFYYGKVSDQRVDNWRQYGKGVPWRTEVSKTYIRTFTNLEPNTKYAIIIKLGYRGSRDPQFFWPTDNLKFVFKTKADVPGTPTVPTVNKLSPGYQVEWLSPRDNGEPILNYTLQYCDEEGCASVYEGNLTRWMMDTTRIPQSQDVYFRVSAMNILGQGPYSANSTAFNYIDDPPPINNMTVLAIVLSIVFVFIFGAIVIVYCLIRRQQQLKQKPVQKHFIAVSRGPDMELATLRDLPTTTVQQNNTLYTINLIPTDGDIAALPHFRRDQLMLTKFLGSGAFGEVFEGVAKNILDDNSGKTKVAVKTLRKSASDQEKEEFLKEALLMSNFKHDHILSLLGVCLDNDPQFIILELMEGGDLLSFLRANRPSAMNSVYLSLADLMKICVHVSRGCTYLEEMHFVHRDLAARNCLVSSKNPRDMVVKIGDFGLARDIYKNDYYRKEGEGLLPVRWMSPESLVDGVFTTQSDIWAFGVLSWEVLTFGQQPYQARTNIEVLHFVRSGGQLDQPENCPQDIFELMRKCWSCTPEDRPSFSTILKQLEEFHENCAVLLTDYIIPVRSRSPNPDGTPRNHNSWRSRGEVHPSSVNKVTRDERARRQGQVLGCDPETRAKRKKRPNLKISLPSPENYHQTIEGQYRKIHRATSFDSPEPRETEVNEELLDYLNPKLNGSPSYLQLISDPSDPPPHAVHSKSRLSSHNSRHASLNSRHNSQSSQSNIRKPRSESQSSRHSSASTDIYSSPVGSNLNLDLPSVYNGRNNCEYEQIHSMESIGGKYASYMMTSPSIPEDDDDAFPEGYDYVDYSHPKVPKNAAYSVIRGTLQCLRNGYSKQGYSAMDVNSNNHLNILNNNLSSMDQEVDNIPGGRSLGQACPVHNAMFDANELIQASLV
ncbi:proto-oncogene tyrosine-protein kinase ROS-like isoform X2 [Ostrea edulis]|uniref:proto-oncogene tyrosine-protein kinase ROS-like isoform X2 n=1 Tax=Ostrea edulis TaxID=37623 RepID=UPI0024AFE140|nr:proto-oncogene tyrosine-protein kinase ROS-like isoform X2 [Ostrea edulis]